MKGVNYVKNKASNNTQSIVNYTRTKDAYDGNMELTNLKSSNQKLTGSADYSVEPLPESARPRKDGPGGE